MGAVSSDKTDRTPVFLSALSDQSIRETGRFFFQENTVRALLAAIVFISAQVGFASEKEPNPAHPAPAPSEAKAAEHQTDAAPADAHAGAHAAPDATPAKPASSEETPGVDPKAALQRLMDGNQRFVDADAKHPRADQDRRCLTSSGGQHPYATILSCADSRVPPELVFDAGIGDLFIIRVAGNVADTDEIASIEYGSEHLGSNLIVVMGHTKCGAVTAVVNGAPVHGNLAGLLDNVVPAVEKAKHDHEDLKGAALVPYAVRANVMQSVSDLLTHSEAIHDLVASGKVQVVGAVYDIHSGSVQFLGEHPDQTALLKQTPVEASHETQTAEHPTEAHDAKAEAKEHPAEHGDAKSFKSEKNKKTSEEASTTHEQHSDASKPAGSKTPEETPSALHRFGPPVAFGVGSAALTSIVFFMLKK